MAERTKEFTDALKALKSNLAVARKKRIKGLRDERIKLQLWKIREELKLAKKLRAMPPTTPTPRITKPITLKPIKPMPVRYHPDNVINGDIKGAFEADIGTGESLFGDEQFYNTGDLAYSEELYQEDFFEGLPDFKKKSGSPLFY